MRQVLLAVVVLMVFAPSASAARIDLDFQFCGCDPSSGGEDTVTLLVTAAPAEANELSITARPGGVLVEDAGAPLTGACRRAGSRGRFCTAVDYAVVDLGDADDTLMIEGVDSRVSAGVGDDGLLVEDGEFWLDGGPGADRLEGGAGSEASVSYGDRSETVTVRVNGLPDDGEPGEGDDVRGEITRIEGGEGDDRLEGGPRSQSLSGANGSDVLIGGNRGEHLSGGEGDDELSGGEGDDELVGGPGADVLGGDGGRDTASYQIAPEPVRLSIGGGADDGAAGEGDEIRVDVENLQGGGRADVLIGDDGDNELDGSGGRDVLMGRGGSDSLQGMDESRGDQLDPGPGEDRVSAESRDLVYVADGEADLVECFGEAPQAEQDRGVDRFESCAPEAWMERLSGPDRAGRFRIRVRCRSGATVLCEGRVVLRLRGRAVSRPVRLWRVYPGGSRVVTLRSKVTRIPRHSCLRAVSTTVRHDLPSRTRSRRAVRCRF